ncbi:MAG: GC-type dockerin domain-anchored protein [Phycisphaerales bacterium]
MRTAASIAILIATSTAAAQTSPNAIEIVVDPPIIERGESATIELRAHFESRVDFAIAYVFTSLVCDTGSDYLSDHRLLSPMDGPGTQRGFETIAGIENIVAAQIQFHDIRADPTDPMPFWSATYTANHPAPVFGWEIAFQTRTARYSVFECEYCASYHSRLHLLEEGNATLTVVACRADINQDRQLDLFDYLAFFNAFDAGEAIADFDFDGELTVFDFLAFQNRFDAGCS